MTSHLVICPSFNQEVHNISKEEKMNFPPPSTPPRLFCELCCPSDLRLERSRGPPYVFPYSTSPHRVALYAELTTLDLVIAP